MKILKSELEKYIPELKASIDELKEVLTMLGHLIDKVDKVNYKGKDDYLIDYETRHNRADLLSVIGICRDLASYYGHEVNYQVPELPNGMKKVDNLISIKTKENVEHVVGIEIQNVTVKESPKWLKEYLEFYGINPINNLVDLSNYVMLITGYPSHIIDLDKASKPIVWNKATHTEITTLSGEQIQLDENILTIEDDKEILALAGIIGGKKAEVDRKTKNVVVEMAIYKPSTVRKNSIQLATRTEASIRLEKVLDSKQLLKAFAMLISLIRQDCSDSLISGFQEYSKKRKKNNTIISLDYNKVPAYAGIQITRTKVKQILEAIGSKVVSDSKDIISIEVPENRYDLKSETELIEEVIRKNGFYEIPHNEPIYLRNVKNITPRYIKVVEELREILPSMGYDEVLNWPLVDNKSNQSAKNNTQAILVENSVNEGVPELRKTISASLINNLSIYNKRDVRDINIFEIGPIWEMKREKYNENIGLGLLSSESSYINSLEDFRLNIEKILSKIGIQNYEYRSISKDIPKLANKHSYYRILKNSEELGTLCKIKGIGKTYLCELNINLLADLSSNSSSDVIVKKEKIQWIDKNVEKSGEHADLEVLNDINTNQEDLFVSIVDKYPLDKKTRYTIRTGN